jgi:hypothetical protein
MSRDHANKPNSFVPVLLAAGAALVASGYKLRPLRHPDKLLLVTLRFLAPGSTVDPVNCIGCLV